LTLVSLLAVHSARQATKVAQHLEASDPQAARPYRAHCGILALRMPGNVGGVQHHLREPGRADRAQLRLQRPGQGDGVHAEMVQIQGLRWLTTSSKVTPSR